MTSFKNFRHLESVTPSRGDFLNALKDMKTYIDISVDDLMTINKKVTQYAQFRCSQSIPARDLMTTPVVTVTADATLSDAARRMLDNNVAGLPVVDSENTLLGLFTEADLLAAVGLPRHQPTQSVWGKLETIFSSEPHLQSFESKVGELMVKDVITVSGDDTLGIILEKMKIHNIKRIVVTDSGLVEGIVTRSNLVRTFLAVLAHGDESETNIES